MPSYESHFDQKTELALPRHRGNTVAGDVNLLAGAALSKANEIFTRFGVASAEPTPDELQREYASTLNKADFVAYFAAKAWRRDLAARQLRRQKKLTSCLGLPQFCHQVRGLSRVPKEPPDHDT
jgi:hypothetical protein